jgi:hypothetical protein
MWTNWSLPKTYSSLCKPKGRNFYWQTKNIISFKNCSFVKKSHLSPKISFRVECRWRSKPKGRPPAGPKSWRPFQTAALSHTNCHFLIGIFKKHNLIKCLNGKVDRWLRLKMRTSFWLKKLFHVCFPTLIAR